MQFLSRVTPAAPDFQREQSAGSRLPYAHHVNDRVVRLRDGTLMLAIRMQGLLFETAETEEINYRKNLRDAMLRAIGSSRYAVYHHIVRRRVAVEAQGDFPDAFSRDLDAMWQDRLAAKSLYSNELFLTLIRRPVRGGAGLGNRIARWLGGGAGAAETEAQMLGEARALEAAGEQLLAALATYRPAMLGVYDTPHGPCSEPLEMLALLYNADLAPVRLPYGDAGEVLPRRRVSFGADTLELAATAEQERSLAAIVSAKDYPGQTVPGMLDELLRIPAEMVVTQSFAFVDRQASLGRMNLALRRMRAADDEALSLRAELAQAKDEVAAGRAAFGEHHLTVMVRGDSQGAVDSGVAEVQSALTDLGMVTVREDIGLEAAFWAQFPGNFGFIARRVLIGSANFASLASWHNFPLGQAAGNHWGDAVATFETTAAGPYHFNFHHGDLGNFTAIGPSGSGKTVIVNFLLAQARRFAPRIVFFDKDRGAELFIRAIGGVYDVLRPGVPSRMNPLRLADTADNRRFLMEWIAQLVSSDGAPVTAEETAQIKEAVVSAVQAIWPIVGPLLDNIKQGVKLIAAVISGDWDQAWQRVKNIVRNYLTSVKNLITTLAPRIAQAAQAVGRFIWQKIKEGVAKLPGVASAGLSALWAKVKEYAPRVGAAALDIGTRLLNRIKEKASELATQLLDLGAHQLQHVLAEQGQILAQPTLEGAGCLRSFGFEGVDQAAGDRPKAAHLSRLSLHEFVQHDP